MPGPDLPSFQGSDNQFDKLTGLFRTHGMCIRSAFLGLQGASQLRHFCTTDYKVLIWLKTGHLSTLPLAAVASMS
jgi:hypothetical protein